MNIAPTWTDTRISQLKQMRMDGYSASKIAAELGGISRGAVLGKLHRLGLCNGKRSYIPRPKVERPAEPLNVNKLRHKRATHPVTGIEPDDIIDIPPDTSEFACTIGELGDGMCRWPLAEPSADMPYCGAPTSYGAWCARHHRLVYSPITRRR